MTDSISSPPAQYNAIATSYDKIWSLPAVRPLLPLLTSTLSSVGPFTNARVLDLACGTGMGLRIMRSLGATHLVGVDISAQMLEVARATTPDITLHRADCTKSLEYLGLEPNSFDIILGMWLLNYCPSSVELAGMWTNISTYLKPGGRFVGIIENHNIVDPKCLGSYKYGCTSNVDELKNGQGWSVHVSFNTDPEIEFDAYRLRKEILEREAANAGMQDINYRQTGWQEVKRVIGEGVGGEEGKNEGWWAEFVDEAPNLVVWATKQ
jgi:SAM-dependent methyltransferase